jgi:hypothetical protein
MAETISGYIKTASKYPRRSNKQSLLLLATNCTTPLLGRPIPTINWKKNHSMWDAFEHILLFISLYVWP